MFSIDKDASIKLIDAIKETFQAFGSTRLLGYGMLIGGCFLSLGESSDAANKTLSLYIIAGGFGVLAVSYIIRPHDSNKKPPVPGAKP